MSAIKIIKREDDHKCESFIDDVSTYNYSKCEPEIILAESSLINHPYI
jgi:hypothetical protein